MKKEKALQPVEVNQQLEAEISFEIVELEDEMLGDVFGGLVKDAPVLNGSQCSCSNIAC
ncbi:MAG: hypothetical protein Tsb0020_00050 [Haliangiales bacterium]